MTTHVRQALERLRKQSKDALSLSAASPEDVDVVRHRATALALTHAADMIEDALEADSLDPDRDKY